ncbi:hypothetical protein FIBSPDRAFT_944020 [Athelia psychrophila]|uniref:Uncharacterized protein n=1 Tax=Athelia psychrophila TaxID=1759441 RepID=A0A166V8P2_9AGAM|nr:hypothetical protein FIBSPDRAFT_944020 [Fibularhizoctonia sp. CBS 109695]
MLYPPFCPRRLPVPPACGSAPVHIPLGIKRTREPTRVRPPHHPYGTHITGRSSQTDGDCDEVRDEEAVESCLEYGNEHNSSGSGGSTRNQLRSSSSQPLDSIVDIHRLYPVVEPANQNKLSGSGEDTHVATILD